MKLNKVAVTVGRLVSASSEEQREVAMRLELARIARDWPARGAMFAQAEAARTYDEVARAALRRLSAAQVDRCCGVTRRELRTMLALVRTARRAYAAAVVASIGIGPGL